MQKITKLLILNIIIVAMYITIYAIFFDKLYIYSDVLLLSCVVISMLARVVILRSKSSFVISFVIFIICDIIIAFKFF